MLVDPEHSVFNFSQLVLMSLLPIRSFDLMCFCLYLFVKGFSMFYPGHIGPMTKFSFRVSASLFLPGFPRSINHKRPRNKRGGAWVECPPLLHLLFKDEFCVY